LSLHDALPIYHGARPHAPARPPRADGRWTPPRTLGAARLGLRPRRAATRRLAGHRPRRAGSLRPGNRLTQRAALAPPFVAAPPGYLPSSQIATTIPRAMRYQAKPL